MTSAKLFAYGTHRAIAPEQTLETIAPHLSRLNITRCADVTGLDSIGIPVYVAVRPTGVVLQVSNGKGLRAVDAKVSALMEAIEFTVAEQPRPPCRRTSRAQLVREGKRVVPVESLPDFNRDTHFHDDRVLDWVEGDELLSGTSVWLPASIAYFQSEPVFHAWSTNGLASGNNALEATLHGLYEVIERDSLSQLVTGEEIDSALFDVVDTTQLPEGLLAMRDQITAAGLKLVLLRIKRGGGVHTFMAVILDPNPYGTCSTVNDGSGAHLSPLVAAARAITEAAQSRLTFIHGSREDLPDDAFGRGDHTVRLYDFFSSLEPDTHFEDFENVATADLAGDLQQVLRDVRALHFDNVYRIVLATPGLPVSVVKVCIPNTQLKLG